MKFLSTMNFPKLLSILLTYTFILRVNTNHSNEKSGKETWQEFSDESATEFNHLAVDEYGRRIYIGAVNRIYQLSTDFELQINYTISELAPADCTAADCLHKLLKRNTTKVYAYANEVLVLDYQNQQLISCGTFFEGICHAHDINNISKIWTTWSEPIVETQFLDSHTVAFIAPSLSENSSTPLSTLHVGFNHFHNYTVNWPRIISIRNLKREYREYFSSVLTRNTGSQLTRNDCPTESNFNGFNYGFSSENVGYFIAGNYKLNKEGSAGYLIASDTHKNTSCNKVPIICISGSDATFNGGIQYVYIQKRNLGSGSKTDSHETEEKIMFTLETDNNIKGFYYSACRYKINKLRSLIRKDEPLKGDLIFAHLFDRAYATAMAVTSINNYTILFIGTSDGRLQKISIKGFDSPDFYSANKYADITIDAGSWVHSDMLFDSTMNFLYVMTRNKLTKVKIHNCDEYKTSDACLVIKDPYCGWCFPSNKCCLKSECDVEQNPINWVSYDIDKYIEVSSSTAKQFSRTAESNVTFKLIIPHPFINHTAKCLFEFGNFFINTTGICNKNSINCVTPTPDHLPPTPIDNHSIVAELSVQTNHFPVFQKIPVIFYDCNNYESCLSCMSSLYPCQWYANEFRCTDNANWKEDDIVIGMNLSSTNFPRQNSGSLYEGKKFSKNSMFCPQFFTKDKSDIYIPANAENKEIRLYFKIPINIEYTVLFCKFVFDSNKQTRKDAPIFRYNYPSRNGVFEAELICEAEIFDYAESKPFIIVELSVLLSCNGSIPLDNTYGSHIIVYKCAHMGDQCPKCLNNTNYSCMWNSQTKECKYYDLKDKSNIADPWLHDIQQCSNSNHSTNWLTENNHLNNNPNSGSNIYCSRGIRHLF